VFVEATNSQSRQSHRKPAILYLQVWEDRYQAPHHGMGQSRRLEFEKRVLVKPHSLTKFDGVKLFPKAMAHPAWIQASEAVAAAFALNLVAVKRPDFRLAYQ
jgi:hypothetical protein